MMMMMMMMMIIQRNCMRLVTDNYTDTEPQLVLC